MNNSIKIAKKWLNEAEAILVTASNGFSISEGLNLFSNDQKLREVLGDLEEKYHFQNLLSAFGFDYPNELEQWRVYARIAEFYSINYESSELMKNLKKMLNKRPYFVWTSNTDHHFDLAGLENTLEVEGNWLEGVCSQDKDHEVVDLKNILHQIYIKDQNGQLTDDDIPKCSECGSTLKLNLPGDFFQMNQEKVTKFSDFLQKYQDKNLLVLELGIGPHNEMIKAPSMQLVAGNEKSHFITINKGELFIPDIISERSIGFSTSIDTAFQELLTGKNLGGQIQGPAKPKPKPTPEQQKKEDETIKLFYPSYMVDRSIRPGELTMYLTVDSKHPSHFHLLQEGQPWMYSLGNSAIAHCFTKDGQYYQVKLGLDKTKGQVHGFYFDAGTFIAFEDAADNGAGFSQISAGLANNSDTRIMIPKVDKLIEAFPNEKELIKRLSIPE